MSEVLSEISSLLGVKESVDKKSQTKQDKKASSAPPSEMESKLSVYLENDKETEGEEIVPCCLYFIWGSYLACCTEDVAALKLLDVHVSKRKNPMDFDSSRLYVIKVRASGIHSVDFTGKNHLYLDLFLGRWSNRTKVLTDSGPDANWNYGDTLIIDAASKTIAFQPFRAVAYDKNKLLGDVFIGDGSVTLNSFLEIGFDQETDFSFPISDGKGNPTGNITVTLLLRKRADV